MSGNLDVFGRNELDSGQVAVKLFASSIRQRFNVVEGDDGSGREYLMEQDTPDLLCLSPLPGSGFDPEDLRSSDCYSLCPTLLDRPSLVPPQSAGRVTLGGAFRVNPGWPRWVDTSLFVDIESGTQPPCLAVPHSLNLPITRLSWTHPMRHWCRSFEEVEEVSVHNITVQGLPGDDDFLNSAAGRCIDSDSEDDDSVGYRSEVGWSESSESGSSMHYTDSIEDLVGRDWLVHEGGIVSLE
ncbi:hypothetical protein FIBSPDRAFT_903075 [Athelia psychrophila]|uniref:Uncharacterized protein n=1 Tax=Athelia psychrophila TaxID=1759441 RepID=A0A167WFR0_9AGAM|nr:hypothetical protein FIBSPDRAFT_903075 [Fibularhizoctonia sp. CBS 109695]